jgi:hypothetical protein
MNNKKGLGESKKKVIQHLEIALKHLEEAEQECGTRIYPNWQWKENLIREAREKVEEALKYKER